MSEEEDIKIKMKPTKAQEHARKAHEKTLQGILKILKRKRETTKDADD